jgi:DNA-binding MarR family transcriptional regulator
MTESLPSASPLFLREDEVRRGIELLHFGHVAMMASIDDVLTARDLGQAHYRALYFIGRQDDQAVGAILTVLGITKQSFGRILQDLDERGLVETRPGLRDRRQKLLRLTRQGRAVESELFTRLRERMAAAYSQAGQGPVTGFWRVLEGLLDPDQLGRLMALQIRK